MMGGIATLDLLSEQRAQPLDWPHHRRRRGTQRLTRVCITGMLKSSQTLQKLVSTGLGLLAWAAGVEM